MKRAAIYSRSRQTAALSATGAGTPTDAPSPPSRRARLRAFAQRHDRPLLLAAVVASAVAVLGVYRLLAPAAQNLTQEDIDAAVMHTLKERGPAPSHASMAYEVIRPSVVLVRRLGEDGGAPEKSTASQAEGAQKTPSAAPSNDDARRFSLRGVGTGVVFSQDGLIFTNLHVVAGAEKIGVTFADGTESDVELVNAQPENDLAILKAKTVPDDLRPATLRSTRGLRSGDEVLAVGFPFGIGPTATYGVVSGLRRQFFSEEGRRNLVDLIQFDAAANPGNSGGPLVTREGDVVGIVTSILNPTDEGFFVGIAFAVPIENAASAAGVSPF
jgi:serine protease DegQ